MMSFRSAGLAAALLCLGATGCERAVPVAATTEYEASVRTVGIPPSDRTRLYILTGKTTTGSLLGPQYRLHLTSGDIYIDGVKIGSLNPKEVMVLDVNPGKHVIYWTYLNQTGGPRNDRLELDLQGGTTQMLGADINGFDLTINKALLVTADNPGPRSPVPPVFKIVRPSSCPPTICV
jgi:hypothetical protein